jgi:hypothetical protein
MTHSAKHLALAFLVVVFLVLFGRSGWMDSQSGQSSLLTATTEPGAEFSKDPHLFLSIPDQSKTLGFSSQAEVLFFDLEAQAPYTLRYLTVALKSEGVELPETPGEWKLYSVHKGRVDHSGPVGYGEKMAEGFLRFRLFPSSEEPALGFQGTAGTHRFAVVAPLYKAADPYSLSLTFRKNLPAGWDWEYTSGVAGPWMNVSPEAILGVESVGT